MAGNQGNNRIVWQDWQIKFLQNNWQRMTAQQLADALGLKRTIVRMKKYELGLYKMKLEYWSKEQIAFLKAHYKTTGDVELAEIFNQKWKKEKGWTKNHISKKMAQLGLSRTKEQYLAIWKKHNAPGGRNYTILKNSGSINYKPGWVVSLFAWRDKEQQKELLKDKELVKTMTNIVKIKQKINGHKKQNIRPE